MTLSTRLHGAIDYGVAALFAGLSTSRALSPPVRASLGIAGAYHTSYALVTDYEAGLRADLTMRQHLMLDALGGAGLCAAGLLLGRQPPLQRMLLVAAGVAELVVVSQSSATPRRGPGDGSGALGRMLAVELPGSDAVGYPPLDTLKPVAEDVFIVDSALPGAIGAVLPVCMTVIRLESGDLLLHSPTRFTPALKARLESIGRIGHLVAPSFAHWIFMRDWQRACPQAVTWAAPGVRGRRQVRRSGLRIDHELGEIAPAAWGRGIELLTVPGGLGFRECALFHQPSATLVLTDLVMNLERPKVPPLFRPLLRWFGMLAPDGMPPPYLRALVRRRRDAAEAARRLLARQPERVIFAHGEWFDHDATAALRRSLRWLVD